MGKQTATHTSKDKHSCRSEERSQASAGHIAGSGPQADVLDLQHAAGNRAVSEMVQSSHTASRGNDVPPIVRSVLNSSGQPLDPTIRTFMESRFGHDFSQVRVHTNEEANQSAATLRAKAYTLGNNIAFGEGRYQPDTLSGKRLLAHELAHVVQQHRGGPAPELAPDAAHERSAEQVAAKIAAGTQSVAVQGGTAVGVAREPEDDDDKPSAKKPRAKPAAKNKPSAKKPRAKPTAKKSLARGSHKLNPLRLPKEGVDMPWVGSNTSSSELGYSRDQKHFWSQYQSGTTKTKRRLLKWKDHLSPANKKLIAAGKAPIVDKTWLKYHPQHAAYRGQILEHHHVGQGSRAVPLPEKLHDAYTALHPQRQKVSSKNKKKLRPLKPQPTPARQQREIARHVRQGRLPHTVDPKTAVKAGAPPLSSEIASVPPAQRRPVSPKQIAEVARLDPKGGKVPEAAMKARVAPRKGATFKVKAQQPTTTKPKAAAKSSAPPARQASTVKPIKRPAAKPKVTAPKADTPTSLRADPTSGPPAGHPARKGPNFKPQPYNPDRPHTGGSRGGLPPSKATTTPNPPNPPAAAKPTTTAAEKSAAKTTVKVETAAAKTAGKAEGVAAKTLIKAEETAIKAEAKLGSRVAAGAGRLGLSLLLPGPEDPIMLMAQFAGSYQEAWEIIEQRNTRDGIAFGIAAGMMDLGWDWVEENLWRRFATRDVATHFIGAVGKAERSFNDGLVRGHKYGAGHPPRMKNRILAEAFTTLAQEGYETDEEGRFTIDTVARVARVLMPIADNFLSQAAERKQAREEQEFAQKVREQKERNPTYGKFF